MDVGRTRVAVTTIPMLGIVYDSTFEDTLIHTNTIEGFWALIKRAWYGSHHHYTRRYMPLFVGEAAWKYNHRKQADPFEDFLQACFK